MSVLLASAALTPSLLTYRQARKLTFQSPDAIDARRNRAHVTARHGEWEANGWTFRLFARNCTSQSCLVGWVHVDRATGAMSDPVSEKPIHPSRPSRIEAQSGE